MSTVALLLFFLCKTISESGAKCECHILKDILTDSEYPEKRDHSMKRLQNYHLKNECFVDLKAS